MIFLVQFGINKHSQIFQRLQIALALRARAIFCSLWKICSCLFIPNCTRNHLITYTNRTRLHKIRRPRMRNNYIQFYNKNLLFISSRRTTNSRFIEKQDTFSHFCFSIAIHAKKPTESWHKAVKICQSHQKPSEWQKVTSRFTEIVVKTHENVGVDSSYLSGYFNSRHLEFS